MAEVNVIVEAEKPANKQTAKKKSTSQQIKAPAKKPEEQPDIMEKLNQLSRDLKNGNAAMEKESKARHEDLRNLEQIQISQLDIVREDLKTLKEHDVAILAHASQEQLLLARAIKEDTEKILVSQDAMQKDLDDLRKANRPLPAIVWLITVVAFLVVGIIARVTTHSWLDALVWAIMAAAATVIIIVIVAVTDTGGNKEKKDEDEDD